MNLDLKPWDSKRRKTAVMPTDPLQKVVDALGVPTGPSSDFDLNPDVVLPAARKLRDAGVLVPIIQSPGGLRVILTKRSSALKHHPGQIAFPGGKVDDTDASPTDAALRESFEEIGLLQDNVNVLGLLPTHETVTNFRVTPVIGQVKNEFTTIPEPGEVDEVFSVPLDHLTNIANFQIQSRLWHGQARRYYVVPFGPYYIWGATARILRRLAEGMRT